MTFQYLLVLATVQVELLLALEPYRSECERLGNFIPGEKDHSLSVSVLATHQVSKPIECGFYCTDHEQCKTFNYQYGSSGSTHTCELLDKTKASSPSAYISKVGFIYYEPNSNDLIPCQNNPCRHGGTCKPLCGRSYVCLCSAPIFTGDNCEHDAREFASCQNANAAEPAVDPDSGYWLTIASKRFQAYCDNGWTLIARFSNADSLAWMNNNGYFWYDRQSSFGISRPDVNQDMLNEAFWLLQAAELRITRSDDAQHTALLTTTGNCLNGKTLRQKITSYGRFTGTTVWASDACRGSCNVIYGGTYTTTRGFIKSQCDGEIQTRYKIGFWCDWSSGDGAVMMIGGGGSTCARADHGIGLTEANEASFGGGPESDFGDDGGDTYSTYALNLWVR